MRTLYVALALGAQPFDPAACDVSYTFDVRDWVVDYLRPTKDLGGKAARQVPYKLSADVKKAAILVNNSYPGPAIEATEGDLVCVTVVNNLLAEAIAIHWHGQHMHGYPAFDGVYGVTQAGIAQQGGTMVYRWRANAGTHMYHAHMQALQSDKGLKGPVVIKAKNDPHKALYTQEQIVTLSDEWQNPEVCLKNEGAQPGNPVCAEIEKATWNGQWGDGSAEYPWPLVEVEQGVCYRLRFVALMGQTQNFQISLAGHNMTIIALDGADVAPFVVSKFNLHAGERADVVVCADQDPGSYVFEADYDLADFLEHAPAPYMPKIDSAKFWAFLHYKGQPVPTTKASHKVLGGYDAPKGVGGGAKPKAVAGEAWDTNLQAAWSKIKNLNDEGLGDVPADITYTFEVGVSGPDVTPDSPYATTDKMYMFTERGHSWKKPSTPYLHTRGECGADGVPVLTIDKPNATVEVVINNLSPTAHVLHMHGMRFSVVNYAPYSQSWCSNAQFECFFTPYAVAEHTYCPGVQRGDPGHKFFADAYWGCPYDESKDNKTRITNNPLQKDMISLWRRSWAVIRFRVENPGVWLFHCHMEQHIPTGQVMAFNLLPKDQPPVPGDVPTEGPCPVWSDARSRDPDLWV